MAQVSDPFEDWRYRGRSVQRSERGSVHVDEKPVRRVQAGKGIIESEATSHQDGSSGKNRERGSESQRSRQSQANIRGGRLLQPYCPCNDQWTPRRGAGGRQGREWPNAQRSPEMLRQGEMSEPGRQMELENAGRKLWATIVGAAIHDLSETTSDLDCAGSILWRSIREESRGKPITTSPGRKRDATTTESSTSQLRRRGQGRR